MNDQSCTFHNRLKQNNVGFEWEGRNWKMLSKWPISNTGKKKRFGGIMSNFWGQFLFDLWCKIFLKFLYENVAVSALKSCMISIWDLKKKWPLKTWKIRPQIGLNSQSNVYCSIRDTSLCDFYVMTLLTQHHSNLCFITRQG